MAEVAVSQEDRFHRGISFISLFLKGPISTQKNLIVDMSKSRVSPILSITLSNSSFSNSATFSATMDSTLHPIIAAWLSTIPLLLTNYSLIGQTTSSDDPLLEATRCFHAIVLAPLSQDILDFLKSSSLNMMETYAAYKNNLKTLALSSEFVQTPAEIRLQKYLLKANNLRAHFKLALCAESSSLRQATPENYKELQDKAFSVLAGFVTEISDVDREIRAQLHFMTLAVSRIQKILCSYSKTYSKMICCDQCGYKTNPSEIVNVYEQKICSTCFDDNLEGYDSY